MKLYNVLRREVATSGGRDQVAGSLIDDPRWRGAFPPKSLDLTFETLVMSAHSIYHMVLKRY